VKTKTKWLEEPNTTCFIADIAANHDGDLQRAIDLIFRAKEAGADIAKFQHFKASNIVSGKGFSDLSDKIKTHQTEWSLPVDQVYDQYHTRQDWDEKLIEACVAADIEFMTTPYDIEAVHHYSKYCSAIKIGSGDITYHQLINEVCKTGLPILIASGASDLYETEQAIQIVRNSKVPYCLFQCNTNYTGDLENFKYVNLNVLKQFAVSFPEAVLGLSDHTPGHSAVLGAVSLGARVIEKHFTDDNSRVGPDHKFALDPTAWREMVDRTRELELSLGDGIKRVEENERNTYVVQRRAIRAARNLKQGEILSYNDLKFLRPCPDGAAAPYEIGAFVGRRLGVDLDADCELMRCHLAD
jgi:N-acetylneuraminate synthase